MNLSSMPCHFLEGYLHILVASVGEDLKDDGHQKPHKNQYIKARTNVMDIEGNDATEIEMSTWRMIKDIKSI